MESPVVASNIQMAGVPGVPSMPATTRLSDEKEEDWRQGHKITTI
jgi:hypothetical protein